MERHLFFLILAILSLQVRAQESFTKYYNSTWQPSTKQEAVYYREVVKKDSLYHSRAYFMASNKVEGIGMYADTAFYRPIGLNQRYNEDGRLTDSSFYFPNGAPMFRYLYYQNGKLLAYYTGDENWKQIEAKGYDEAGNEIKDYIFEKEAEYPGGAAAWIKFISNIVKSKVPIKNKAPNGTYKVIVRFIVDKNGLVSDLVAETNFGYGMEEEAIRAISKSPKWIPAVQNNKKVNAYRRQPITFVVQ